MTHRCHVEGCPLGPRRDCRRSVGDRHLACRVSGIDDRGLPVMHAIRLSDRSTTTDAPTVHTPTSGDD
jgi:hypothetical protein